MMALIYIALAVVAGNFSTALISHVPLTMWGHALLYALSVTPWFILFIKETKRLDK